VVGACWGYPVDYGFQIETWSRTVVGDLAGKMGEMFQRERRDNAGSTLIAELGRCSLSIVTSAPRGKKKERNDRVNDKAMTEGKERHRVDNDSGVSAQISEKRS